MRKNNQIIRIDRKRKNEEKKRANENDIVLIKG